MKKNSLVARLFFKRQCHHMYDRYMHHTFYLCDKYGIRIRNDCSNCSNLPNRNARSIHPKSKKSEKYIKYPKYPFKSSERIMGN